MSAISKVAAPGDCLCKGPSAVQYESGSGTARRSDGGLYATLAGNVRIDDGHGDKKVVHILSFRDCGPAQELVLRIGDECVGRVARVTSSQVYVTILYVGGKELPQRGRGVVRKEDVRATEIDKVATNECFRPGDIIKAAVISLGDSWQYYLSTTDSQHGVLYGFSDSNILLQPVNESEMMDVSSKKRFKRKVAVTVVEDEDNDDKGEMRE